MSNTTNINFNIENNTTVISAPLKGITFIEGEFKRGPVNNPEDIITSPSVFRRIFGTIDFADKAPLYCLRMLQRGALLRINRVLNSDAAKASFNDCKTVTLGGALIEDNTLSIVVNGVTFSQVYTTSSDNTLALIASTINTTSDYAYARVIAVAGSTDNDRVLILSPKTYTALTVTGEVTGGLTQTSVTVASVAGIPNLTGTALFSFAAKYEGVDYNSLIIEVLPASNGDLDAFNIKITHSTDTLVLELYENLKIIGSPTVEGSTYLSKITTISKMVVVTYEDLSALVGQIRPYNGTYKLKAGTDGSATALADYVGDPTENTGLYAFDDYDDAYAIAIPSKIETDFPGLAIAGEAYAANRGDLKYYQNLANNANYEDIITERASLPVSKHIVYIGGGLKFINPTNSEVYSGYALADILAGMAYVHNQYHEWYSIAGPQFGLINNSFGPVNNFGSPAKYNELNLLANNQINMVVNRSGKIMLWDDYTGQVDDNNEKFISIGNFLIYLQKALGPSLEVFLKQPLDTLLFRQIYQVVSPFFRSLVDLRALDTWTWDGDQNVSTIADCQINSPADIALGKYKVRLTLSLIAPLTDMTIDINISNAGTTFEIV